jgi:hypothetical protein
VLGALLAYEHHVLWSTHGPQDSAALWRLATRALLPPARASARTWQVGAGHGAVRHLPPRASSSCPAAAADGRAT